jgi:ribosome biogenesis protein NSA2
MFNALNALNSARCMLQVHKRSEYARKALGLKGKMFAKKRHQEKALLKKTIAMHEEKEQKHKADDGAPQNAVPAYLLERDQVCCSSW